MEISDKPKNYGWKVLLAIFIILMIVVFSVQNSNDTLVKLWFWEGYSPLVFLMVFSFVLGLSFALLAIWPVSRHSKRKSKLIKEMQIRIDGLELQLKNKQNSSL